ncbi:AAA family ATPase, partial [Pirellulaceae bacterium]|nr:AAA family ATPase [Pirellulaceae bacterium]
TGKSAFAKALGKETGRPTLVMDIGRLMGGLVGQTESNVRRALEIVDAMAPAILFIDELEKALSGTGNGGRTDSGVSTRMLGSLLTWLSDHTSNVFVVATANDIAQMPPELTRAERFDGIFFCDLPAQSERLAIWHIWMSHFVIDPVDGIPEDKDWTGSEIRSCCRLASLLGVSLKEAANQIVPIAVTNREAVQNLRYWADRRCLSATDSGVFRSTKRGKGRRSFLPIGPTPSDN